MIALRRHWTTALGALAGGLGGGLYAHFVGCATGSCPLTSSVWTAAAFFGVTGAIVALPGGPRAAAPGREPGRPQRSG